MWPFAKIRTPRNFDRMALEVAGAMDEEVLRETAPSERSLHQASMEELGLAAGTRIGDTFRIVRRLGGGGMGLVTLAYDEVLDRHVAIKFIRPTVLEREDLHAFFWNEARAMARVTHPNVLTVHAFGEHATIPYFVMEYVNGPSVEQWLMKQARFGGADLDEALNILDQACLGVSAIHASNAVHRDLKPSNLLMAANAPRSALRDHAEPDAPFISLRDHHVVVSDLGVARILEGAGSLRSCMLVGTPPYMAPEATLGDDRTELARMRDVYALGCIAYELLTGHPPFSGRSETSILARHLLEAPEPPSSARPGLPRNYDDVVLRALDKDPHRRFESAEAFRVAILRAHKREEEPESILVADDDEDWRALMHSALAARFPEARIDTVNDGIDALAAFERAPYPIVVADLAMPRLDGLELTTRLRALAPADRTSIIVVTAAGGPREWRTLSRLGADGFLVKPVDMDDVAMLARRTLRARRMHHTLIAPG
ncbi:MAG: protein kinase [Polyangiaceae bacterium]|nr:protein kinase [Polyangiaceae bacterium]